MFAEARKHALLTYDVGEELVVYDQNRHRAHRLNASAALIWRRCDGRTSVAELAEVLGRNLNLPPDEELVSLTLDRLGRAQLLAKRIPRPPGILAISRREAMRALGLAGSLAMLPMITSISAPLPAQATSTAPGTGVCTAETGETCCQIGPSLCAGGVSLLQCTTRGGTFFRDATCPT